jgi:hypothetical protein
VRCANSWRLLYAWWSAFFLVLVLSISCTIAEAQTSLPQSPAIELPNQQTTLIESFVSQTLLPLAEKALASSENSDQRLAAYRNSYEQEQTLRQSGNAERLNDLRNWQSISETLSLRVGTLQIFSDSLLAKLGDFSGSEDEKHTKALTALDGIMAKAQAVELENKILKIVGSVLLVGLAVLGGYEGGHALKWW